MEENKKRQRTLWQLGAIGVVLLLGLLIIVIPRRADAPKGGAAGKQTVTVSLAGVRKGALVPIGAGDTQSTEEAEEAAARTVPLSWYAGTSYEVTSEALRAMPEVALALDGMLRAYLSANASYATPIVTAAYTVEATKDSAYRGGYSLELSLLVPSGDEMATVSLSSPLAGAFRAWLISHAAHYGFAVSGVGELRYVGTPHAAYIFHEAIDLAEYVRRVKEKSQKTPLVVETGGIYYEIFYIRAKDGRASVKLPANVAFTASGTGDGFIVTVVRLGS